MTEQRMSLVEKARQAFGSLDGNVRAKIGEQPFGPYVGMSKEACELQGIKARVARMAQFMRDERHAQISLDREFVFTLNRLLNTD